MSGAQKPKEWSGGVAACCARHREILCSSEFLCIIGGMTGWRSFFGILANLALILASIKILTDLVAAWLGEQYHQRLRSVFERWHAGLNQSSPEALLVIPLSALASTYRRALGPNPFSRQAFWRTCVFGSLFLGAALGFTGLFCGKPFAMNSPPWESFLTSTDHLREVAERLPTSEGDLSISQNIADLGSLGSWPFALVFTVYFAAVVVFSTAFLFSASVTVSRLFLQEMITANTLFRVSLLFFANTVLLCLISGASTFVLFILLNIWTWPYVPALFALSNYSMSLTFGLASVGSLCTWFFSAPWLRVVVTVALLPSIFVAVVIGVVMIAFPFRNKLHGAVAFALRLGLQSPRGIFGFLSASTAGLGLTLAALASLSAWLVQLSLSLSSITLFGVNSFVFGIVLMAILLSSSFVRARAYRLVGSSFLKNQEVLFLFLGTLCVITFGFYIQAMLECFVNVKLAGGPGFLSHLAQPAVSAVFPGSVAAYFVVCSKVQNSSWMRASIRVAIALSAFDLLTGARGLCSFRESLFSVVCDFAGAPIGTIVIFKSHELLFRVRSSEIPACIPSGQNGEKQDPHD